MSKPAKESVVIQALAGRMERACENIQFIGRDGNPYKKDYEQEALWYVAYHIAAEMRDSNTVGDWAHFVLRGMEALTVEDVAQFFYPTDGEAQYLPTSKKCVEWLHG